MGGIKSLDTRISVISCLHPVPFENPADFRLSASYASCYDKSLHRLSSRTQLTTTGSISYDRMSLPDPVNLTGHFPLKDLT